MSAYVLRGCWPAWVSIVVLGLAAGCSPKGKTDDAPAETEKSYPITGEVLKVDAGKKMIVLQHEAVEGLMPAMTMEFAVSQGDLANLHEGGHIRARLVEVSEGDFKLEQIWPVDPVEEAKIAAAANALAQDTVSRGRGAYREIGETVPDFALYDQDGKVVNGGRFRGQQVMLNFIYTRCPVATMCPASTANMMTTQRKAKAAGVTNIQFVSITLDPKNDTPGVLNDYARVRGIDTSNFSFLTGPEPAIKNLLKQFGILTEFDGGIIKHTLATLLIDENGKIIYRADGSGWSPDEFVARMHKPVTAKADEAAPAKG